MDIFSSYDNHPKTLYLDCSSGISGDMTVAALLDLGADEKGLQEALASLPLEGYSIQIGRVKKSGIDACDFQVILDEAHENHDHDMQYLHGLTQEHVHEQEPGHGQAQEAHGHLHEVAQSHEAHEHLHEDAEEDHEAHGHLHEVGQDHTHGHLLADAQNHEGHEHLHADAQSYEGHRHLHEGEQAYAHDHGYAHEQHEHLHTHTHTHEHGEEHGEEQGQEHLHGHGHTHEHGHGRNLDDIRQILYSGSLSDRALEIALNIFEIIAQAEASVHGLPVEEVHFHEVGAVDSIVDIASIAFCIDDLRIDQVIIPALTEGSGLIRCQHGLLPVPVPATAAIVSRYALPLHILPIEGELVTPTGAAAAAALRTSAALPASFTIQKVGYGAGKRDYAVSGLLRAMLLETSESIPGRSEADLGRASTAASHDLDSREGGSGAMIQKQSSETGSCPASQKMEQAPGGEYPDDILKLETNVDDCTGETLGFVMDLLLEAGAKDVFYTPIHMKKNRPAVLMSVLCEPQLRPAMEELLFRHTTSIGIRCQRMSRSRLLREIRQFDTPLGKATVKFCTFRDEVYCYPEHESVAAIAKTSGLGYPEVYNILKTYAVTHADVLS